MRRTVIAEKRAIKGKPKGNGVKKGELGGVKWRRRVGNTDLTNVSIGREVEIWGNTSFFLVWVGGKPTRDQEGEKEENENEEGFGAGQRVGGDVRKGLIRPAKIEGTDFPCTRGKGGGM